MSVRTIFILFTFFFFGCGLINDNDGADLMAQDQESQVDILERAQKTEPAYEAENFLGRQAMNEWAERMDATDKLWYIYLRSDTGAMYGYHVCKTPPLSFGVSMTNPKQVVRPSTGNSDRYVVPAPGMDGLYYGAADPELYFCFDAETDAMIHFRIGNSTYYDQPLDGLDDVPRMHLTVDDE